MAWSWQLRDRLLSTPRPALIMGIVNVTPDSFSDGGSFLLSEQAVAHALQLIDQGTDLLDIGGESSRPGAAPISADEESRRILPVIEALTRSTSIPISVDTTKAIVAERALAAGALIINDITALTGDPGMPDVLVRHQAGVVLMHMQGRPPTMQINPTYFDVVAEVAAYLQTRLQATADLGIAESQVVLDPGIGFGKTVEHNLRLLARLEEIGKIGRPICLGVSRKSLLGRLLHREVQDRLPGSLAAVCHAMAKRLPLILRVHDVQATYDAVRLFEALSAYGG